MVATQPVNRIGAHFDSPSAPKRVLPQTERERSRLWSDMVFNALLALQKQLDSRNEAVVAAAANSILELERTRMRHDQTVAGTRVELELEPEPALATFDTPVVEGDDFEPATLTDHTAEVREHMAHVVRRPMAEPEAKAYVVEKLDNWQVRPSQIHPGEFVKMLGLMGELPDGIGPQLAAAR